MSGQPRCATQVR